MDATRAAGAALVTKIETVLHALGAVATGDTAAAEAVVASDFVWHIPGASAVGGDVRGVRAWIAKLHRLIDAGLQPQILSILEGGQHVAVVQRNVAQIREHFLDVRVVNLFTLTESKVARLDTFFSDQHAAERFWDAVLEGQ